MHFRSSHSEDMETVALCGAAGFAGRAMLSALLSAGFKVKALDLDEASWTATDAHGRKRVESGLPSSADGQLELVFGNISEHAVVQALVEGCVAVVHTTVFFPQQIPGHNGGVLPDAVADDTWKVNLKGLWNVLDCAQQSSTVRRVVHVGSCSTVWPGSTTQPAAGSVRFDSDVRRPDGSLYAVQKRLQEEMCRQFYDASGLPVIVLRPDGIMDLQTRSNRGGPVGEYRTGWCCRHQLAAAAVGAVVHADAPAFGVFSAATVPNPPIEGQLDPRDTCNVSETEQALGVSFEADVRVKGAASSKL